MSDDAADRAWALIDLGRWSDAERVAAEGLAADPDSWALHAVQGVALLELGQPKRAQDAASRAIALDPEAALGYQVLGGALSARLRDKRAVKAFQKAVSLEPWNPHTHAGLVEALVDYARAYPRVYRRHLRLAQEHAEECRGLDPSGPLGYLMLAKVALARRDHQRADEWARQALQRDPQNTIGHQLLGLAAVRRRDLHAAGEHFVDAGTLDPNSGSSTALLRSAGRSAPLGALGLFLLLRFGVSVVREGNEAGAVAVVGAGTLFLLVVVVWYFVLPRMRARRQFSPRAKQVLERDSQIRGGQWSARLKQGRWRARTRR